MYMAHVGSFVPAKSCSITLLDALYTRMSTQSAQNSDISSFAAECTGMSYIIRNSTMNSLCLVDEFGNGLYNTHTYTCSCWNYEQHKKVLNLY